MYNSYGQQGGYGQQQPMQQQRTGFQPQSSFGQQQGFGGQAQQQQFNGAQSTYGSNPGQAIQYPGQNVGGIQPQMTGYNHSQGTGYGQPAGAYNNPAQQYVTPQQTGYISQSVAYNTQPPYQNSQSISQLPMNSMSAQRTGGQQGFNGFGGMGPNQTGFSGFNNQAVLPQGQPSFIGMQQQQPFVPQQTTSAPAAPRLKQQKTGANIPSSRLSFVQAADQQKFEDLFAKAVGPYNTALPGEEAKTILMKSGLPAGQLSKIWALSDTTRSGQLLFPEFVLAMHLCNTAIRKGSVPDRLEERVKNEVSSMVDHIAFAAADTAAAPSAQPTTNAPNFNAPQQSQQLSNVSLMAQQMQPAQMGFYNQNQPLQSQMTGYQTSVLPQMTGYQTSVQPQMTGYMSAQQTQQNGYQPGQGMQPGLTGMQQPGATGMGFLQPQQTQANFGYLQSQQTGAPQFPMQPLTMQPTGKPGEWGFVHAPQGSVQGMQALGAAMMPGAASSQGGFQMPQQQQNIEVPWAITKEEKQIYDTIFKAWDKRSQGFVDGPVAIEVFGSSGVNRHDLEIIWALADADDKGKLNSDEFAVALHLIYRRLNGYEIPPVLPPELIPPSTRNFGDSISQVKNMLQQDASARNGPTSYMKNRSFKDTSANRDYSKDGTVYKHNDADVGYVSSSRRRNPGNAIETTKTPSASGLLESSESSISDLRKMIKEKQVLLDAIDQRDEGRPDDDSKLNEQARKDADDLLRQIRKIQLRLDSHQNAHLLTRDDEREKSDLQRQLQTLVDRLPEIASQVRSVERRIQEVELDIWTKQDQKAHPGSASLVGTGPGGQVTEADKRRAKTKAMMAARTAALTGRPVPASNEDDMEAATRRQAEKAAEITKIREGNEQMIRDIEESAESLRKDIESALDSSRAISVSEHERRRWNDAVGVEPEVRDFIRELNAGKSNLPAQQVRTKNAEVERSTSPVSAVAPQKELPIRTSTPTYKSFSGAEDRAAYLKQAAEARMAERLAALGIRTKKKATRDAPSNIPVSNSQSIAEVDDQAREQVLQEEHAQQARERQVIEEKTKKEEIALLDAQRKQEDDLQRVAQQRAAGDLHDSEVKKQQQAARKPVDSRQAKLAQLRAEREARLAEEERLERELAEVENSSNSDGDDPAPTPAESNPFSRMKVNPEQSQFVPPTKAAATTIPEVPKTISQTDFEAPTESTNPFYKIGQQQLAGTPASPVSIRPPSAGPPTAQRTNAPRSKPIRKQSDDWSVVSKEDESSSDEDGPSPADLAARLFSGGMQPQRTGGPTPMTAQRTGAASSPAPTSVSAPSFLAPAAPISSVPQPSAIPQPPPPPPSMMPPPAPQMGMPTLPPPPPPMGGPPPPPAPAPPTALAAPIATAPPNRNALLSSIQAGTGLRKVKTQEKGGISGGRVLD